MIRILIASVWVLHGFIATGVTAQTSPGEVDSPSSSDDLRGVYLKSAGAVGMKHGVPIGRLAIRLKGEVVPVDHVFHEGDEIQFEVSSNEPGWVFIFHRGSAGATKLLWPDSKRSADNHLAPRTTRLIPEDGTLLFDREVGDETFSVVISRAPNLVDGPARATVAGQRISRVNSYGKQHENAPTQASKGATVTNKQILVRDPRLLQKIRAGLDAGVRGVTFRPADGDKYVYFGADTRGRRPWAIATFRLKHDARP
jgi:hypothetical protein